MLEAYRKAAAERAALGIPALPLNAQQTADLVELLKNPPAGEGEFLVELLAHRVPPGVDDAAKVKASFLAAVAEGSASSPLVSPKYATELLGTMLGGYNIHALIELLDDDKLAPIAAKGLKHTLLMFDSFHDVQEKAEKGNKYAQEVLQSWADAEWFASRAKVPEKITVTVFKVDGETNTDDLSPAPDAWSRPDIPLHALAMLKNPRDGITPDKPGEVGPIKLLEELKAKGDPVAYVGDVVGTGSSRKSATNSVIWHTGEDIPFVPNKRFGGVCLGGKIAPIFFNTQEDSGALPIEVDVSALKMGDVVNILPYEGKIVKNGETVAEFELKSQVLLDEVQASRPYQPDYRSRSDRQSARSPETACLYCIPPAASACRKQSRFHLGAKNGWSRLRSARRTRRASGYLLRTAHDDGRLARYDRADDPRRVERLGLFGLLRRYGDAVFLPHRCLSETCRCKNP